MIYDYYNNEKRTIIMKRTVIENKLYQKKFN